MSISSHLSPEPERRLWIILENQRHALVAAEWRAAAVAVFAACEAGYVKLAAGDEPLTSVTIIVLSIALVIGAAAFAPVASLLKPKDGKPKLEDCLVAFDDIAKYTHGELILRLDKYLGGGITATQYYEDIVGQILFYARVAARKQRLLRAACQAAALGQVFFVACLLRG